MKKIVVESVYEFREINSLNEGELNELNLKQIGQNIKGAVTGTSAKVALEQFMKSVEGKDDVDDQIVINTFPKVYARSYGKYPKSKDTFDKLSVESKYKLMAHSYQVIKKDPKRDTPVLGIVDGKVKSGAIKTAQASGTHGNA